MYNPGLANTSPFILVRVNTNNECVCLCEKKITRCVLAFKPSLGLALPLERKLSTSAHACLVLCMLQVFVLRTQGGF